MTKLLHIAGWVLAIAAVVAVVLILAGCYVEHRGDTTFYGFGMDPSSARSASKPMPPDANEYQ